MSKEINRIAEEKRVSLHIRKLSLDWGWRRRKECALGERGGGREDNVR